MKIAVLLGGTSDEREVSLSSGAQVARALREAGHEVMAVDTARGLLSSEEEARLLTEGVRADPPTSTELDRLDEGETVALTRQPSLADVDVYFLALHGGSGEDGTIQALLDVAGVAYTGSDRLGCSLAMDKEVTKRLLRDAGIPTPDWLTYDPSGDARYPDGDTPGSDGDTPGSDGDTPGSDGDTPGSSTETPRPAVDEIESALGLPVIVKASGGGSSLRLVLAHDREELEAVLEESRSWDDVVLFERYHPGREFTVGVVGDETFPVGEIIPDNELFDYECKYQPGKAREIFPADIPEALSDRLRELALRTHRVLRMRDFSRVDFMVDGEGRPWCLEANALPGMTANSLLPKAAAAAGVSFPELCDRIARLARERSTAHSG